MAIIDLNDAPPQDFLERRPEPPGNSRGLLATDMAAHGYHPDAIQPTEKDAVQRFRTEDDKANETSGWYVFYDDGKFPYAIYGDWRSGARYEWSGYDRGSLTPEELAEEALRREQANAARKAEREVRRKACKMRASTDWLDAEDCDNHPYLARKGVPSFGLKEKDGLLLVPLLGPDGTIRSLQTIDANGKKLYYSGTEKNGSYYRLDGDATLAVCEGYATGASIHMATGWTVFIAFDAGNVRHVARWVREIHPSERIVICGDDDRFKDCSNAGRMAAEGAAREVGGSALFPHFANDEGKPTDWNDLHQRQGLDTVKDQLNVADPRSNDRFHILTGDDVLAMESEDWRVQDVLPAQGIAAIFGMPGGGKSFLALDMALAIARGRDWFGYETYPAPVLYINQESGWGLKKRLLAWKQSTGDELPDNMRYIIDPVQIVNDEGALSSLIPECAVTIIDTLSSVSAGLDENNAKDMGLIIAAAQAIRRKTGGLVILIHHTGKDVDKGARGHSSLKGALDTEIMVNRAQKSDFRSWKLTKSKESIDGVEMRFTLFPIPLGRDKRGKPISSCVIQEAEPAVAQPDKKKLTSNQALGIETLKDAMAATGQGNIDLEIWREYFYRKSTADNSTTKKRNFQNIRQKLVEMGLVLVESDHYSLPVNGGSLELDFN